MYGWVWYNKENYMNGSEKMKVYVQSNDEYALGCYGFFYIDYAKLLSARWAELTGTEDECAFDIH